ncbi:MAG: hypothetical protein KKD29_08320, partial [Candidatus Omnitrophica bacterium]|nr:hypothetical protein [Candidatus Omnitrophota bacterium]
SLLSIFYQKKKPSASLLSSIKDNFIDDKTYKILPLRSNVEINISAISIDLRSGTFDLLK